MSLRYFNSCSLLIMLEKHPVPASLLMPTYWKPDNYFTHGREYFLMQSLIFLRNWSQWAISSFSRTQDSSQPFPTHIYVVICITFVTAINAICQSLCLLLQALAKYKGSGGSVGEDAHVSISQFSHLLTQPQDPCFQRHNRSSAAIPIPPGLSSKTHFLLWNEQEKTKNPNPCAITQQPSTKTEWTSPYATEQENGQGYISHLWEKYLEAGEIIENWGLTEVVVLRKLF